MSDTNAVRVQGDVEEHGGSATGGTNGAGPDGPLVDDVTQEDDLAIADVEAAEDLVKGQTAAVVDADVQDDVQDDLQDEDEEDDLDGDEDGQDDGPDGEHPDDAGSDGGSGNRGSRRRGPSIRRLEEEGEVAADYLEELLDIIDLDGDIDIDVENGRASVAIVGEEGAQRQLRTLVGPRGEVLEALQELSRLAVQARTGERSRLMLDVAGFRAARRRTLEEVAARAVSEARRSSAPVRLEPMSAFERKVVHDVVADAGLTSESEGEEPGRRVIVLPVGG